MPRRKQLETAEEVLQALYGAYRIEDIERFNEILAETFGTTKGNIEKFHKTCVARSAILKTKLSKANQSSDFLSSPIGNDQNRNSRKTQNINADHTANGGNATGNDSLSNTKNNDSLLDTKNNGSSTVPTGSPKNRNTRSVTPGRRSRSSKILGVAQNPYEVAPHHDFAGQLRGKGPGSMVAANRVVNRVTASPGGTTTTTSNMRGSSFSNRGTSNRGGNSTNVEGSRNGTLNATGVSKSNSKRSESSPLNNNNNNKNNVVPPGRAGSPGNLHLRHTRTSVFRKENFDHVTRDIDVWNRTSEQKVCNDLWSQSLRPQIQDSPIVGMSRTSHLNTEHLDAITGLDGRTQSNVKEQKRKLAAKKHFCNEFNNEDIRLWYKPSLISAAEVGLVLEDENRDPKKTHKSLKFSELTKRKSFSPAYSPKQHKESRIIKRGGNYQSKEDSLNASYQTNDQRNETNDMYVSNEFSELNKVNESDKKNMISSPLLRHSLKGGAIFQNLLMQQNERSTVTGGSTPLQRARDEAKGLKTRPDNIIRNTYGGSTILKNSKDNLNKTDNTDDPIATLVKVEDGSGGIIEVNPTNSIGDNSALNKKPAIVPGFGGSLVDILEKKRQEKAENERQEKAENERRKSEEETFLNPAKDQRFGKQDPIFFETTMTATIPAHLKPEVGAAKEVPSAASGKDSVPPLSQSGGASPNSGTVGNQSHKEVGGRTGLDESQKSQGGGLLNLQNMRKLNTGSSFGGSPSIGVAGIGGHSVLGLPINQNQAPGMRVSNPSGFLYYRADEPTTNSEGNLTDVVNSRIELSNIIRSEIPTKDLQVEEDTPCHKDTAPSTGLNVKSSVISPKRMEKGCGDTTPVISKLADARARMSEQRCSPFVTLSKAALLCQDSALLCQDSAREFANIGEASREKPVFTSNNIGDHVTSSSSYVSGTGASPNHNASAVYAASRSYSNAGSLCGAITSPSYIPMGNASSSYHNKGFVPILTSSPQQNQQNLTITNHLLPGTLGNSISSVSTLIQSRMSEVQTTSMPVPVAPSGLGNSSKKEVTFRAGDSYCATQSSCQSESVHSNSYRGQSNSAELRSPMNNNSNNSNNNSCSFEPPRRGGTTNQAQSTGNKSNMKVGHRSPKRESAYPRSQSPQARRDSQSPKRDSQSPKRDSQSPKRDSQSPQKEPWRATSQNQQRRPQSPHRQINNSPGKFSNSPVRNKSLADKINRKIESEKLQRMAQAAAAALLKGAGQ